MYNYSLVGGDTRPVYKGTTVASGSTLVVLLGPLDLARYDKKAFTIYNLGPPTLSGVLVQVNPDWRGFDQDSPPTTFDGSQGGGPNNGLWETVDSTSFNSLAAGSVKSVQFANDSRRWWRLAGVNNQTQTLTTTGWCHARTV